MSHDLLVQVAYYGSVQDPNLYHKSANKMFG